MTALPNDLPTAHRMIQDLQRQVNASKALAKATETEMEVCLQNAIEQTHIATISGEIFYSFAQFGEALIEDRVASLRILQREKVYYDFFEVLLRSLKEKNQSQLDLHAETIAALLETMKSDKEFNSEKLAEEWILTQMQDLHACMALVADRVERPKHEAAVSKSLA